MPPYHQDLAVIRVTTAPQANSATSDSASADHGDSAPSR